MITEESFQIELPQNQLQDSNPFQFNGKNVDEASESLPFEEPAKLKKKVTFAERNLSISPCSTYHGESPVASLEQRIRSAVRSQIRNKNKSADVLINHHRSSALSNVRSMSQVVGGRQSSDEESD